MTGNEEQALVFSCGSEKLVAILNRGSRPPQRVGVLIIVGGPQYRVGSHRQFVLMARDLASCGYPVMRFDYRGMGDSSGHPRNFENVTEDIRAAIDTFKIEVPEIQGVVLWGLCDAASAALMYASGDERVYGQILVNPWVRTETGQAKAYVTDYYGRRLLQSSFWRKLLSGQVNVLSAVWSFVKTLRAARGAGENRGGSDSAHFIERMLIGFTGFERSVLFLISGRDLTATEFVALCEDDQRWREALQRPNIRIRRFDDADHTFSARTMLTAATKECVEWLDAVGVGEFAAGSSAS